MKWVLALIVVSGLFAADARAVPLPPEMPAVVHEGCPQSPLQSCTWPGGPIYLPPDSKPRDWWHEVGHQFDYQALTDTWRDRFRALIGDSRAWRTTPNSPHEQFAQAYMLCAMHGPTIKRRRYAQGYGYRPTPRQHARACRLIYQSALPDEITM